MKKNINYYYKYYIELKNRIFLTLSGWIFTIITCYYYKQALLFSLTNTINEFKESKPYFILTDISEVFYVYINLALFISNQIGLILLFYHILIFLTLGLYKNELNKIKSLFKTFIVTWIIFNVLFYKLLIPISWNFFLSFQQSETFNQPITLFFETKLLDFFNYFTNFYFLCFFSYQFLILILFILNNLIVGKQHIKSFRKFFYIIFLLFSTVITPPDVFSQLIITFCLIVLYEIFTILNYLKLNLVTN